MPAYTVEFAAEAERDFKLIFDFLEESYRSFGESAEHAARRVEAIRATGDRLGDAPYRGTLYPEIIPDLRHVTIAQAIYWFFVDEDALIVRVLAVFFGSEDDVRRMLVRLLQRS